MKSIVLMVSEHEYMNICASPPIIEFATPCTELNHVYILDSSISFYNYSPYIGDKTRLKYNKYKKIDSSAVFLETLLK